MCQEPFTQMVHKYQNLVFSICVKMTGDYFAAEDLTQETFLIAYRHKEESTVRMRKPGFAGLLRINVLITADRRQGGWCPPKTKF